MVVMMMMMILDEKSGHGIGVSIGNGHSQRLHRIGEEAAAGELRRRREAKPCWI